MKKYLLNILILMIITFSVFGEDYSIKDTFNSYKLGEAKLDWALIYKKSNGEANIKWEGKSLYGLVFTNPDENSLISLSRFFENDFISGTIEFDFKFFGPSCNTRIDLLKIKNNNLYEGFNVNFINKFDVPFIGGFMRDIGDEFSEWEQYSELKINNWYHLKIQFDFSKNNKYKSSDKKTFSVFLDNKEIATSDTIFEGINFFNISSFSECRDGVVFDNIEIDLKNGGNKKLSVKKVDYTDLLHSLSSEQNIFNTYDFEETSIPDEKERKSINGYVCLKLLTSPSRSGTVNISDSSFMNENWSNSIEYKINAHLYLTISAYPYKSYKFSGWYEGSKLLSKKNPYTFYFDKNRTITARFIKK